MNRSLVLRPGVCKSEVLYEVQPPTKEKMVG